MKIETKFSNGDKVYRITRAPLWEYIQCSGCAGEKRIVLRDKSSAPCPNCKGHGTLRTASAMSWGCSQQKFTIGQIRVTITNSPGLLEKREFDNFAPKDGYHEEYMTVETGIGSGSVFKGRDLFVTREEALAECKKRNNSTL